MLNLPKNLRIFFCAEATDMRKQMNGLAIVVREGLGRNPSSGEMFVFRNRRGDMARVLFYDGQGYCLLSKRLDKGSFRIPEVKPGQTSAKISPGALAYLLTNTRATKIKESA